jgi:hypothetical protein
MSSVGLETKYHYAGEDQQQFGGRSVSQSVSQWRSGSVDSSPELLMSSDSSWLALRILHC